MQTDTLNNLNIAITVLRAHFKKDEISRKELTSFRENRKDVYFPAAFWSVCQSKTKRATFDFSLFDGFVEQISPEDVPTAVSVAIQQAIHIEETEEQIRNRIDTRFAVMDMMAMAAIEGNCRSLIICGAAGVGKSHTVLQAVSKIDEDQRHVVKGSVTPPGLFKTLWKYRHAGQVLVFDDADDIWENERCLNYLKAVCDSSEERFITRAANSNAFDDDGEEIPSTFPFNGSVIFITNKDFKAECQKNSRLAVHMQAMMSRSHVLDLGIHTDREYIVRIKSVVFGSNMLEAYDQRTREEVVQFIEMNSKQMMELSLRVVKKIADLTRISPDNWREVAMITCAN